METNNLQNNEIEPLLPTDEFEEGTTQKKFTDADFNVLPIPDISYQGRTVESLIDDDNLMLPPGMCSECD